MATAQDNNQVHPALTWAITSYMFYNIKKSDHSVADDKAWLSHCTVIKNPDSTISVSYKSPEGKSYGCSYNSQSGNNSIYRVNSAGARTLVKSGYFPSGDIANLAIYSSINNLTYDSTSITDGSNSYNFVYGDNKEAKLSFVHTGAGTFQAWIKEPHKKLTSLGTFNLDNVSKTVASGQPNPLLTAISKYSSIAHKETKSEQNVAETKPETKEEAPAPAPTPKPQITQDAGVQAKIDEALNAIGVNKASFKRISHGGHSYDYTYAGSDDNKLSFVEDKNGKFAVVIDNPKKKISTLGAFDLSQVETIRAKIKSYDTVAITSHGKAPAPKPTPKPAPEPELSKPEIVDNKDTKPESLFTPEQLSLLPPLPTEEDIANAGKGSPDNRKDLKTDLSPAQTTPEAPQLAEAPPIDTEEGEKSPRGTTDVDSNFISIDSSALRNAMLDVQKVAGTHFKGENYSFQGQKYDVEHNAYEFQIGHNGGVYTVYRYEDGSTKIVDKNGEATSYVATRNGENIEVNTLTTNEKFSDNSVTKLHEGEVPKGIEKDLNKVAKEHFGGNFTINNARYFQQEGAYEFDVIKTFKSGEKKTFSIRLNYDGNIAVKDFSTGDIKYYDGTPQTDSSPDANTKYPENELTKKPAPPAIKKEAEKFAKKYFVSRYKIDSESFDSGNDSYSFQISKKFRNGDEKQYCLSRQSDGRIVIIDSQDGSQEIFAPSDNSSPKQNPESIPAPDSPTQSPSNPHLTPRLLASGTESDYHKPGLLRHTIMLMECPDKQQKSCIGVSKPEEKEANLHICSAGFYTTCFGSTSLRGLKKSTKTTVTVATAYEWMNEDLATKVNNTRKVFGQNDKKEFYFDKLSANEQDAISCFAYNVIEIGKTMRERVRNYSNSLDTGDEVAITAAREKVTDIISQYIKVKKKGGYVENRGLINRRKAEVAWFEGDTETLKTFMQKWKEIPADKTLELWTQGYRAPDGSQLYVTKDGKIEAMQKADLSMTETATNMLDSLLKSVGYTGNLFGSQPNSVPANSNSFTSNTSQLEAKNRASSTNLGN